MSGSQHWLSLSGYERNPDAAIIRFQRQVYDRYGVFTRFKENHPDLPDTMIFEEVPMPQYANPDNPNAGELITTKVDPASGAVIEVSPDAEPKFLPMKDDREHQHAPRPPKEQSESDRKRVAARQEKDEAAVAEEKAAHDRNEQLVTEDNNPDGTKTVAKSATTPPKAPPKTVKPVEKAGEKVEAPAPPTNRGVLTTQTPVVKHVDAKSPVFEDKKGTHKD